MKQLWWTLNINFNSWIVHTCRFNKIWGKLKKTCSILFSLLLSTDSKGICLRWFCRHTQSGFRIAVIGRYLRIHTKGPRITFRDFISLKINKVSWIYMSLVLFLFKLENSKSADTVRHKLYCQPTVALVSRLPLRTLPRVDHWFKIFTFYS